MFVVGFSYISFIMLKYDASKPISGDFFFFMVNKFEFCQIFLCIYWNNHMLFLIFHFVNMVCDIDWFANIDEFLIPWIKSHLIMIYVLFKVLWDSIC